MNADTPPRRLTLTTPKDKSKCFEMLPLSSPTTPTSCITHFNDDDFFDTSFDQFVFEEHKQYPHKQEVKAEVKVEDLFRKTLPRSLVSQKCPSLNFSYSSVCSNVLNLTSSRHLKFENTEVTENLSATAPNSGLLKRNIKILNLKKKKVKDYRISPKDRPITCKRLKEILFKESIQTGVIKCPCKKFDKSFACFTAREWINTAFEIGPALKSDRHTQCELHGPKTIFSSPCSCRKKFRSYEYQDKKLIYECLMKSPGYDSFSTSSSNSSCEALHQQKEKCKTQIIKDIPRTFANLDIFGYPSVLQQLYRILYSYSIYDPQLGYIQGMNLLVGALLMHAEENVAFWLFVSLVEDYEMRDVFADSLCGVQRHCAVIKRLIKQYLPELDRHFEQNDIYIEMFATSWICSLFCSFIPVPFLHCFLTRFFKDKWVAFYRLCISILAFLQPKIMKTQDLSFVFEIFKELRLEQDYIKYENREYVDDPAVVEVLMKWRTVIKNSDKNYPDIAKFIVSPEL